MTLEQLIVQARAEKRWLFSRYQGLWFSPDQLEEENRNGRFRWGAVNWELRDPVDRIIEARRKRDQALADYERIVRETPL